MPREKNVREDILSKLLSAKLEGNNKSLIKETLKTPSIAEVAPVSTIEEFLRRITPIMQYFHNETLPHDSVNAKRIAKEASYYTVIGGQLYRSNVSQQLLKCLSQP